MRWIAAWFTALVSVAIAVAAEEAEYLVWGGDAPVGHACNGFVQEVQAGSDGVLKVHVATSLAPIGAGGRYDGAAVDRARIPDGFELPRRLGKRLMVADDPWQAATDVLEWASREIAVRTSDTGPQDARSVLTRGYGRCSGVANATVALLLAAGFEARTVSGVLVASGGQVLPHRWLECRLPGAGWVGSDPTLGLWTVTPRHMVFGATVGAVPQIEVLAAEDDGLQRLPTRNGRVVRPNLGADLVCRLPHAPTQPPPVVVLRGGGGEVRRSLLDPEARFAGLLPGRWVLEVEVESGVVERRDLLLKAGDLRVYTVESIEADERWDSGS